MQKKYQKRSELTEKTNMGYPTLADELNIETVNDQLSKVKGLGFALHTGSTAPKYIENGGNASLRIESINENVARITRGMDGLFETSEFKKKRRLFEEDEKADDKKDDEEEKKDDEKKDDEKKEESKWQKRSNILKGKGLSEAEIRILKQSKMIIEKYKLK